MKLCKVLSACLLLAICLNVSAQTKKKSGSTPPKAEAQAAKIIDFTNLIIDLNNQQIDKWSNYETYLEKASALAEKVSAAGYNSSLPTSIGYSVTKVQSQYVSKYESAIPTAPAFSDKDAVIAAVSKAREEVNSLDAACVTLDDYFKNKDFLNDKYLLKYAELSDAVDTKLSSSRKAWRNAVVMASDAGEDAEGVFLKNGSISEFVTPMKKDMRTMRDLMCEFYDLSENKGVDYSTIADKIEAYKNTLATNKDISGKNVSVLKQSSDYTRFYDKAEECAGYLSSLVQEFSSAKPNRNIVEKNNSYMKSNYNSLKSIYENFAKNGAK